MRRVLGALAALLLAAGCAEPNGAELIALHGDGGDAWAFQRAVTGELAADTRCDEIIVTSPAGAARAAQMGPRFAARVPLGEGANEVVATCRTRGGDELRSAPQHWRVPLRDRPRALARVHIEDGRLELDATGSQPGAHLPARLARHRWTPDARNPAALRLDVGQDEARVAVEPPTEDGEYYVRLQVTDELGRSDEAGAVFRVRGGRPHAVDLAREHPAWVDDAVVYGIAPFFFSPPGFAGIRARLGALDALGVDTLWLSPINASPDDDFGYAVTDHFGLRASFGSPAELRALVDEAHARGMRVIMDFVPNHTSDRHPYYLAGRDDPTSPYFDFFERDAAGDTGFYFDWAHLPNLDFDHPEVRRYVLEAFLHWVREYDIDGFRVDVAWGVTRRSPEFWPQWRRELKRVKPDLLLLAEAPGRDPYYYERGFDAAYDWGDELGRWAWHDAFEQPARTGALLRVALTNGGDGYPPDALLYRFLNNNDTGARFVTRYGVEVTRVAAALLLTAPGIPGLYTGDELGAAFDPYDEGPPLAWQEAHELGAWYRELIALRRAVPALRSRSFTVLEPTPGESVLAYVRHVEGPGDVLVVLNFSADPVEVSLPRTPALAELPPGPLRNLLDGGTVSTGRELRLPLPPHGVRVLAR